MGDARDRRPAAVRRADRHHLDRPAAAAGAVARALVSRLRDVGVAPPQGGGEARRLVPRPRQAPGAGDRGDVGWRPPAAHPALRLRGGAQWRAAGGDVGQPPPLRRRGLPPPLRACGRGRRLHAGLVDRPERPPHRPSDTGGSIDARLAADVENGGLVRTGSAPGSAMVASGRTTGRESITDGKEGKLEHVARVRRDARGPSSDDAADAAARIGAGGAFEHRSAAAAADGGGDSLPDVLAAAAAAARGTSNISGAGSFKVSASAKEGTDAPLSAGRAEGGRKPSLRSAMSYGRRRPTVATKRRQRWLGYLDLPLSCETLYIVRAPSAAWKETILRGAVSASSLHATRTRQNSAAGGDGLLNRFRLHPLAGDTGEKDMASLVSSGLLISLVRQGGIGSKLLPPLKVCLFAATAANIDEVAEDDDLLAHVKPQKTPIVFADRPPPEKEKEQQRNALLDSIRQRRPGAARRRRSTRRRRARRRRCTTSSKSSSTRACWTAWRPRTSRRGGGSSGKRPLRRARPRTATDPGLAVLDRRGAAGGGGGAHRAVRPQVVRPEGAEEDQEEGGAAAEGRRGDGRRPQAVPRASHACPHFPHCTPHSLPTSTPHSHLPTSHPASPPLEQLVVPATRGAPR